MTTSERRRLRQLAEQFPAAREALLSLAGPRKAVKPEKRQRLAAKKESREDRISRRAAVRDAAMFRDGGRCVLCGYEDRINDGRRPLHMHHVIGRHEERIDTVAMLCEAEHKAIHGGDLPRLHCLAAWCRQKGYAEAARHLARRIEKAEHIRAPRAAGAQP